MLALAFERKHVRMSSRHLHLYTVPTPFFSFLVISIPAIIQYYTYNIRRRIKSKCK